MKEFFVKEFRSWSPFHFLFDAGLTIVTGSALTWAVKMPWYWSAVTFLGVFLAITSAIGLIRQNLSQEEQEKHARLKKAKDRIFKLADMINVTGVEIRPALTIGPEEEWRSETQRELRAIIRSDICEEYEKILRLEKPERSAKMYLVALADTLSYSHLI